jgi:hypothetical protein
MALLGEMHCTSEDSRTPMSLPRGDGVAFAAQESWIESATIKVCPFGYCFVHIDSCYQDNILFGNAYDEGRYKQGLSLSLGPYSFF